MIHIKGYWILNCTKSKFIEDGENVRDAAGIEKYRLKREKETGMEIILRFRELPGPVRRAIIEDFTTGQYSLQELADRYDVAKKTVNNILTTWLEVKRVAI